MTREDLADLLRVAHEALAAVAALADRIQTLADERALTVGSEAAEPLGAQNGSQAVSGAERAFIRRFNDLQAARTAGNGGEFDPTFGAWQEVIDQDHEEAIFLDRLRAAVLHGSAREVPPPPRGFRLPRDIIGK